ncbi:MAG: hypothetical protein WAT22_15750 [Saprospiraceae bacterium]
MNYFIFFIIAVFATNLSAQSSPSEILGLFSSGYAGAGAAPKVNLKTYQFTALVGKSPLDFYLHNSVPTVVPTLLEDSNTLTKEERRKNPSRRYLSNDILQQVGGLLNLSLGKKMFFGRDSIMKDVKGGQLDLHIGGKLLESPFESGSKFFPAAQAYFDYKYLIPLFNNNSTSTYNKDSYVGNFSLRVSGSVQKFFINTATTDPYSNFFRTYNLDDVSGQTIVSTPRSLLLSANFEGFFYITNQIAISGGYFYSNNLSI